ncbi:MAG: hypothetical protein IJ158_07130 [Treponema sp.]|nr:hypothetical protein [Treponema sp.]
MKKRFDFTKMFTFSALSLLTALFFGCGESSGLGPEVDVIAPTVSVTSHEDDDTVPSKFMLKGTAWDDTVVNLITIDFDDADLHYKVTPGGSWYKKTASLSDWQELDSEEASCTADGKNWIWEVYVDTNEKSSSKTDNTFEFSAVAVDKMENSGKNSKVERSLTVDTKDPDVSLNSPWVFPKSFDEAKATASTYSLRDGNIIAKLLNGDLTFSGRQENSISFKELRIEFDDGALDTNARKVTGDALSDRTVVTADVVAESVAFDDDTKTKVYYSKTLKRGEDGIADLRNWSLTIPMSEWVSSEKNPELLSLGEETGAGKLIRVVTTSVSDSYAWEKKVLGYFVWWPEADSPWITTYVGDAEDKGDSAYEVYPSSNLTGTAQDDDGIISLTYEIQKKGEDGTFAPYPKNPSGLLSLSEENAKYSAWPVKAPSENGNYSLTVTVVDLNGKTASVTKYFKTLDVSPPKIEIKSPENGASVLSSSDATVHFTGTVADDGSISTFYVAFLNQNLSADELVQNKVNFMNGSTKTAAWSSGTEEGFTDSDGNRIYKITLDPPDQSTYSFSKDFKLFADLGIDGENKKLDALDFIFRVEDNGGTPTVEVFTLSGDTESPSLSIDTLVLKNKDGETVQSYTFSANETPTLPVIQDGYNATISGTWGDNSTTTWDDDYKLKILPLKLTWGSNSIAATLAKDGTWTADVSEVSLPTTSGIIKAILTDYAGNAKTATRSVFIESAEAGLESIGCDNDDGAYKAGEQIEITLEFTKATTVTYTTAPTLTLNNGKTATYVSGGEGQGSSKHIYRYTVASGDDKNILDVTAINANDAVWKDASTGTELAVTLPPTAKRIGNTRNIKIDTTAPSVSTVEAITADGSYKKDAQIFLKLTFSEAVSFTDDSDTAISNLSEALKLEFAHQNGGNSVKSSSTSLSGSNSVIFIYTVANGDNANPLTVQALLPSGLKAKDEAGNEIASWDIPSTNSLGKTIVIDTSVPSAPTISAGWSEEVVISSNGTHFTLENIEDNATVEYSLDNGTNWITYPSTGVSLTNNGTYTVTARQTDKAGNVSDSAAGKTVTVDKGDLLTAITASTVSGTYSTKKGGTVTGLIKFRAAVTIPSGKKVTLNVKNGSSTSKTVSIDGAGTTASSYTFTYDISEGDYIENNAELDVTGWTVDSVTYLGKPVSLDFGSVSSGKNLSDNRDIYILTGGPTVKSVDFTGEGSDAVLKVTFDREISKVKGNITFTQDTSTYRIPAVLTVSEWNSIPSSAQGSYTKGVNGAVLDESGSTLTNDTTTKYVLDYSKDITDSTLCGYFTDANMHVKTVPIVASAVTASGKVLTVTLGSTYALPTKGATYTLSIPANAVTDEAQNKNEEYTTNGTIEKPHLTAEGVESPVIRINRKSQVVTPGNPNYTTDSTVTMYKNAQVKIDCRTPNSYINYSKNEKASSVQTIVKYNDKIDTSKNVKATVGGTYIAYNSAFLIGGGTTINDIISSYDEATGLKVAIGAYAYVGTDTQANRSAYSYEYATRSVLKLNLQYTASAQGNKSSGITENGTTLTLGQLKVWVNGGDAQYGSNSIGTFPLSWSDSSKFQLMSGSWTDTTSLYGKWFWSTWNLSANAYHGFVLGNVPNDAVSNGPKKWFVPECSWVSQKYNYPLWPGEEIIMETATKATANESNTTYYINNGSTFRFNVNNAVER